MFTILSEEWRSESEEVEGVNVALLAKWVWSVLEERESYGIRCFGRGTERWGKATFWWWRRFNLVT